VCLLVALFSRFGIAAGRPRTIFGVNKLQTDNFVEAESYSGEGSYLGQIYYQGECDNLFWGQGTLLRQCISQWDNNELSYVYMDYTILATGDIQVTQQSWPSTYPNCDGSSSVSTVTVFNVSSSCSGATNDDYVGNYYVILNSSGDSSPWQDLGAGCVTVHTNSSSCSGTPTSFYWAGKKDTCSVSSCHAEQPGDYETTFEVNENASHSKNSKLSTGATIGIIIGDIVFMILIAVVFYYIYVWYVSKAARRVNSETSAAIRKIKRQSGVPPSQSPTEVITI
jgi:hypothetical protein